MQRPKPLQPLRFLRPCDMEVGHLSSDDENEIQPPSTQKDVLKGTGSPYKLKVYYLYHNSGHCTHNPVNWL